MTFSVLEGHCPIASLLSEIFHICGVSRGPSASREHLVWCRGGDPPTDSGKVSGGGIRQCNVT